MTVVVQVCPENITWPLPWPHNGVIFQEYTLLTFDQYSPNCQLLSLCTLLTIQTVQNRPATDCWWSANTHDSTWAIIRIHGLTVENLLSLCRSITKVERVWKQNEGLQRSTDTQQHLVCVIYHCTNDVTSWNSVNPFTKHWLCATEATAGCLLMVSGRAAALGDVWTCAEVRNYKL